MAYFEDLTLYRYWEGHAFPAMGPNIVNVGWLERGHDFPKGAVPQPFIARLWHCCRAAVMMARGFHDCEFCRFQPSGPLPVTYACETLELGYEEIRAFGRQGRVFAAPNLIFHYVTKHCYKPPEEFIDAVLHGPLGGTAEFEKQLQDIGFEERPLPLNLELLRKQDPVELRRFWEQYAIFIETACTYANLDGSSRIEATKLIVDVVTQELAQFPGNTPLPDWFSQIADRIAEDTRDRHARYLSPLTANPPHHRRPFHQVLSRFKEAITYRRKK
jgi:hypothetical protein